MAKGRPCLTCRHDSVRAIERAIHAGQSDGQIASRYGLHTDTIRRHRIKHMSSAGTVVVPDRKVVTVTDRMAMLIDRMEAKFAEVERNPSPTAVAAFMREYRAALMDLARLRREWDDRPQVNILVLPEWQRIRSTMIHALQPYPEARAAIGQALLRLEEGSDAGRT